MHDLRLAARALRRRPILTGAVVTTLALGIGVNTAIFSLVDAVLLHPLDLPHADRLVAISRSLSNGSNAGASYGMYEDIAVSSATLAGVGASYSTPLASEYAGEHGFPTVAFVTDQYFTALGVRPALGRTILPDDPSAPGSNPVVVLSHPYWQKRFGGNPAVLGKSIHVRGQPLTIIGVASSAFRGVYLDAVPDMWAPVSMISALQLPLLSGPDGLNRSFPLYRILARLAPGASLAQAAADIERVLAHTPAMDPSLGAPNETPSITVVPLATATTSRESRAELWRFARLVYGVAALTLLLACLNIANLLVVRGDERRKELGIRMALGAGARRLAGQLLMESVLLAGAGAVIGLGTAAATLKMLAAFTLPGGVVLSQVNVDIDGRALVFALVVSLVTAITFGVGPAAGAGRTRTLRVLHGGGSTPRSWLTQETLVGVQVALSLVLLIGAGLLLRTIITGLGTGLGFDPDPLAAVTVDARREGRHVDAVAEIRTVVSELEQQPGVLAAAAATHVPLAPAYSKPFAAGPALNESGEPAEHTVRMGTNNVTSGYFDALGIPVLAGRPFTREDGPDAPRVTILNESAARALWPGQSPIGKEVHARFVDYAPVWFTYTVVGVVRDTKYRNLQDDEVPFAFVPVAQEDFSGGPLTFVVRTHRGRAAIGILQQTLDRAAPGLMPANSALFRPRMVSDQVKSVLAPQRFGIALMGGFALLALCVVAVGIYGAVAYTVSRRTAEIGIRIALGAGHANVLRVVLFRTGMAVSGGAAVGVAFALVGGRLIRHLLNGIEPSDVPTFAVAVGVLFLIAMAAAVAPSWRAVRTDPVSVIRTVL